MDERLNQPLDDEGMATRRTVSKGIAAAGFAALFGSVGARHVIADSNDGDVGDVDDGDEDDVDDGDEDDVDDGNEDDNDDDDQDGDNPAGGVVKGHRKSRKRGKRHR